MVLRQVVDILLQQRLEFEQRLDALSRRSAAPCREGTRRRLRGLMHFRRDGESGTSASTWRRCRIEYVQRLRRA